MKTIVFYSYKGGVGRTLALVNVANRLAEFGKKVCIIDFDLEAPGLEYKYNYCFDVNSIKTGIVDYIYKFSAERVVDSIEKYAIDIPISHSQKNIYLIPAGNHNNGEYWQKLSRIDWWKLLYEKDSQGLQFFLNMKTQIENSINPDYLLIDSRTGITESSSLTMSLLADKVVVLAANNQENLIGSKMIIDLLLKKENNLLNINREIHFVLTRVPLPDDNNLDKKALIEIKAKNKINQIITIAEKKNSMISSTHIIHSDRETEDDEYKGIYFDYNLAKRNIDTEYMKLYNALTDKDISEEERADFERNKKFQYKFSILVSYYSENDAINFLKSSTDLLKKYSGDKHKVVKIREITIKFWDKNEDYEKLISECDSLLEIDKNNYSAHIYKAWGLFYQYNYEEAYEVMSKLDYNKMVDVSDKTFANWIKLYLSPNNETLIHELIEEMNNLINLYPSNPTVYNVKACFLYSIKLYNEALDCVYKALELDTEYSEAYATLAEIKYLIGEKNDFYQNFELALKYDYEPKYLVYDQILYLYKEIIKEERFQNLLLKYNKEIVIDSIQNSKVIFSP